MCGVPSFFGKLMSWCSFGRTAVRFCDCETRRVWKMDYYFMEGVAGSVSHSSIFPLFTRRVYEIFQTFQTSLNVIYATRLQYFLLWRQRRQMEIV